MTSARKQGWIHHMKKRNLRIGIFILFVIILITTLISSPKDKGIKLFESTFDIKLPNGVNSEQIFNNYSGPPYEGYELYKYIFSEGDARSFSLKIEELTSWSLLPLSEELELLMYGGIKNGMSYVYNIANKVGLPKVKNGFWLLKNDHQGLLKEYSFDFTLAIYDSDNKLLYLFKVDT